MSRCIADLGLLTDPRRLAITEITDRKQFLARFLAIERVATRRSGGGVCLYGGACRGVVVERALRGDGHLVPTVAASRRRIILTGMASLVGLPIPRTPASVRRDHVRSTFRALYAEWPSLIHLDHRLRPIPRVQRRLRLTFSRRIAGGVLRRTGRVVAGAVAGSIHNGTVSLAGSHGGLPHKFGRLSIDAAAWLGTLEFLVRRIVQLFRVLGSLWHGHWIIRLVSRPARWRRYGIMLRTNAHTAVPSAGCRTTAGALRDALLLRALLRGLRARLRGLSTLMRLLRTLLRLLTMMVKMMVMIKIGPVLRAGAHAEGREA